MTGMLREIVGEGNLELIENTSEDVDIDEAGGDSVGPEDDSTTVTVVGRETGTKGKKSKRKRKQGGARAKSSALSTDFIEDEAEEPTLNFPGVTSSQSVKESSNRSLSGDNSPSNYYTREIYGLQNDDHDPLGESGSNQPPTGQTSVSFGLYHAENSPQSSGPAPPSPSSASEPANSIPLSFEDVEDTGQDEEDNGNHFISGPKAGHSALPRSGFQLFGNSHQV
jgi:hypothetical protein